MQGVLHSAVTNKCCRRERVGQHKKGRTFDDGSKWWEVCPSLTLLGPSVSMQERDISLFQEVKDCVDIWVEMEIEMVGVYAPGQKERSVLRLIY